VADSELVFVEVISVEAMSEARNRKTAASDMGAEEMAAIAQSMAKKANLGENATIIRLVTSSVGAGP
jgi:hypothetical protein